METFESNLFGNLPMPSSFDELITMISITHPEWNDRVWMWRGQSNIEWPLHSTAVRRLKDSKYDLSEEKLKWYEKKLLIHATHKGFRQLNGKRLTDFELLARLRHHSAATRLIDFTRNALVGLFFACSNDIEDTGALFGFHSAYVGGYEGELEERVYDEVIASAKEKEIPITWEPTNVTARIAAQHSQFMYSTISSSKKGSLIFPEGENSYRVIAISQALKKECLRILEEVYDLKYQTLFPDLSGFGQANSTDIAIENMFRW